MSRLYIRNRTRGAICFLHNKQEILSFVEDYLPGRPLFIGDLAQFNAPMKNVLLKFIEENPAVDCYSSEDIADSILVSRFYEVIKEPANYDSHTDVDEFMSSAKDYQSTMVSLNSYPAAVKLRAPLCKNQFLKILL